MPVSDKELSEYYENFEEDESEEFVKERNQKKKFFQEKLSEKNIDNLEEGDIREIIRKLWAFEMWASKDYVVEEIIDDDIEKLKKNLKEALHGSQDKSKAYDELIENIRMMGPASASEILSCVFPEECGIWNRKAREGLKELSYSDELLLDKKNISGEEYERFNQVLLDIQDRLEDLGHKSKDLIKLDYFLYDIVQSVEKEREEEEKAEDFDHDEMIKTLEEIGDGLGFDVKTEYSAGPGARLDVKWSTKVANLGSIGYAFEVQRRGSRDSAIVNLQQAKKADPTIQKLVIVSTEDQIEKFKEKIDTLDESFRKSVSYMSVDKVEEALENLRNLRGLLQEAGLMKEIG